MVQFFEDGQRRPPGHPCPGQVLASTEVLADVDKHAGLVVAVAELTEYGEGLLAPGGTPGVVAEVLMGVAETVERGRLAVPVA